MLYGEDERVDVVTARTEFYDAPAALPTVEHATIREDLFRRDFTINAMAVSLKGEDFGRLVDPFGGRRDLAGADDPRPAQPLVHRRPDPDLPRDPLREPVRLPDGRAHAAPGARLTIEMGLVGDLSSARLRDELVALLEEGDVGASILRLAELGAGARDPSAPRRRRGGRRRCSARMRGLNERYGVDVPAWRLGVRGRSRGSSRRTRSTHWLRPPEGAAARRRADRRAR